MAIFGQKLSTFLGIWLPYCMTSKDKVDP